MTEETTSTSPPPKAPSQPCNSHNVSERSWKRWQAAPCTKTTFEQQLS